MTFKVIRPSWLIFTPAGASAPLNIPFTTPTSSWATKVQLSVVIAAGVPANQHLSKLTEYIKFLLQTKNMHCPKIMFWRLIDLACILAALLQLGFIIEGFIKPTLLNTSVKEVDLRDMDFPIEIKICAQPGFNETALREMGYEEGIRSYFSGPSTKSLSCRS